ncbi:hypothetical protein EJ04DRAFT_446734, partial [Polyplosphaeria fusca]
MTPEPNQKKPRGRVRDLLRKFLSPSRTPCKDNEPITTPCANASVYSEGIREDTLTTTLSTPPSSTNPLKGEATQKRNAENAKLLPGPMPGPASAIDADDDGSAASTLWETAYDNLKKSDPKLIGEYEERLSEQLMIAEAVSNKGKGQLLGHGLADDPKVRREQMKKVLEAGFDMASNSKLGLREKTAHAVDVVTTFKSLIDEAVKVSPEASLAWAGVSFFLPMLTNLHTENEAFKEAFSYVTSRAPVYAELEKEIRDNVTCTSSSSVSESLTLAFTELYAAVITFQAKAAGRVFGKKAGKALKDAFKWDKWKGLGDAVKDAESELLTKMRDYQSRLSRKKLEEIVRNGQEYHRQLKS